MKHHGIVARGPECSLELELRRPEVRHRSLVARKGEATPESMVESEDDRDPRLRRRACGEKRRPRRVDNSVEAKHDMIRLEVGEGC